MLHLVEATLLLMLGYLIRIQLCQEYDLGDVTPRPIPSDLDFDPEAKVNKTEQEEDIEECMAEYVECFVGDRKRQICAMNDRRQKRNFASLCLMEYENCKIKESDVRWRYYSDDFC